MVLSAPRSASTWVANWLTTDKTLCLHDPVLEYAPEELDQLHCDRRLGVSCTGLALLPDFVNRHLARKVVIHRNLSEVNQSLVSTGLSPLSPLWKGALERIEADYRLHYHQLFDPANAKVIYEHLTSEPFDLVRFEQLRDMHVEPYFDQVRIKPERARDFRRRVAAVFA